MELSLLLLIAVGLSGTQMKFRRRLTLILQLTNVVQKEVPYYVRLLIYLFLGEWHVTLCIHLFRHLDITN